MAIQNLLHRRCTIERPTPTTSDLGEQSFTFAVIATDVRCDIQERAIQLTRKDVGEFIEGRIIGFFLPSQDIKEKDRIIDDEGETYEVKFVDDLRSLIRGGTKHHKEVVLLRPHTLEQGGPFA